ncbi:MAG: hypothetical protein KDD46_00870 [Bdellovibrionales bacterium]|nr:hypothetical protein [Bdellovibrionales bacterium]
MTHKRKIQLKIAFGDFQVRFILSVLALSLFVSTFLGYKLYNIERENTKILQIQNEMVSQLVGEFDQGLLLFVVLIVVLQAVALVFLIVHLMQRVAGPIYRIQKELETSIQTGEPAQVHPVRKNDEFQEFFKVLQLYVQKFKNHD